MGEIHASSRGRSPAASRAHATSTMRAAFHLALFHFASFANQIEDAFKASEAAEHAAEQQAVVLALIHTGRSMRRELDELAAVDEERSLLSVAEACEVRWQRMQQLLAMNPHK